jgi:hypothetical protein
VAPPDPWGGDHDFLFHPMQGSFHVNLIFSGPVILEKKIFKSPYCIFSSPELKALVSLSVINLSVCKLFTFLTSFPEPMGQFQQDLAQIILGGREFKFV